MAILTPRLNLKPYEYPQLLEYRDAIRHAYWLHTEYSFSGDVQDWYTRIEPKDRKILERTLLAIAQIEVAVKTFWARLYDRVPKPEVAEVGMTFAESEVRHANAYAHLLELLQLDARFEALMQEPVFRKRYAYCLHAQKMEDGTPLSLVRSIILFSAFIEHVSLFSQFLILMAYNRFAGLFRGVSNVVEATSKEEQIHGMFGQALVQIFREEMPELFDGRLDFSVYQVANEAYQAERDLLDWIFEDGELDFLPKAVIDAFLQDRFNRSLKALGFKPIFHPDTQLLESTRWFDEELLAVKEVDFFAKRSVNYTKRHTQYDADALF